MGMVYFEKTVRYTVGGRYNVADTQGFLLTNETPWVGIPEERYRDFKLANKRAIMEGLIRETLEPNLDWETPNTFSDEQLDAAIKTSASVKKALEQVNSVATAARMLERAKEQNRSKQVISLLEDAVDELNDEEITIERVQKAYDEN